MAPHTNDASDEVGRAATTADRAVGWYRHPSRPREHRFWDGRDWTDWTGRTGDPAVPPQRGDGRWPDQTS